MKAKARTDGNNRERLGWIPAKHSKAMSYTVHFSEVGRYRDAWCNTFRTKPDEVMIAHEVRQRKCLASRSIDIEFLDDDEMSGYIIAGIRSVGGFKVIENP